LHFSCLRQVCLRRDLLLISLRYGLNWLDSGRVLHDGGLHEVGVGIHRVARDVLATCVGARWREAVRVHVDVFIVLSVPPLIIMMMTPKTYLIVDIEQGQAIYGGDF
jgi:hypothetical protein